MNAALLTFVLAQATPEPALPPAEPAPPLAAPPPAPPADPPVARGPDAVFVVDPKVVGLPAGVAQTASGVLAKAGADEGVSMFTRDDVRAIVEREADLQALDSSTDGTALALLGQKVGARWVLASVISVVEGETLVEARLIDVEKVSVASRRLVKASEYGGSFVDATAAAARLALSPIFFDRKGTVVLTVSEEGADVVVDHEMRGTTPLDKALSLPGGTHLVVVKKEGFIAFRQTVRVEQGKALALTVTLRPSAEFLADYRFTNGALRVGAWASTGVALLAAAGTIGSYVLFDQQNAETARTSKELEDVQGGVQIDPEQEAAVIARRQASIDQAGLYGAAFGGAATSTVVFGVAAGALWLFGKDPGRYDALQEEPGPER